MTNLIDMAYEKAQDVLAQECSPIGLMASPEGYPHVWARDSVITSLGAQLTPGHEACLRTSLRTLAGQQSELGAIPNNVSVATGRLDHTNAGSVDSNLWFILGIAEPYPVRVLHPVIHPGNKDWREYYRSSRATPRRRRPPAGGVAGEDDAVSVVT